MEVAMLNAREDDGYEWLRDIGYPARLKVARLVMTIMEKTQQIGLVQKMDFEMVHSSMRQYDDICTRCPDMAQKSSLNASFGFALCTFKNFLIATIQSQDDAAPAILKDQILAFRELVQQDIEALFAITPLH